VQNTVPSQSKIADNIPPPSTFRIYHTDNVLLVNLGILKKSGQQSSPYGFCEKINKTIIAADCASSCSVPHTLLINCELGRHFQGIARDLSASLSEPEFLRSDFNPNVLGTFQQKIYRQMLYLLTAETFVAIPPLIY